MSYFSICSRALIRRLSSDSSTQYDEESRSSQLFQRRNRQATRWLPVSNCACNVLFFFEFFLFGSRTYWHTIFSQLKTKDHKKHQLNWHFRKQETPRVLWPTFSTNHHLPHPGCLWSATSLSWRVWMQEVWAMRNAQKPIECTGGGGKWRRRNIEHRLCDNALN